MIVPKIVQEGLLRSLNFNLISMKYSLVIISIFIFQIISAQRFSVIEKDGSNAFLFDESNSMSLISLAQKMFEKGYSQGQVISPEMLDFIVNKGLEDNLA
ncbi:MAG: hypothetical protein RI922_2586, partial [Bacteroidota bacterium]